MFKIKFSNRQLSQILETIEAGFDKVAEAINNLKPPEPPPDNTAVEGTIVARYRLNEDEVAANPGPKTFTIVGRGFKSAAGTAVGAGDVDLSVDLGEAVNMTASIANQRLSDDGNEVMADVTIEGNAQQPTAQLAVLKYAGKNRDTGNEVCADTDEFETGPGEATIGEMDTPVPLTEV